MSASALDRLHDDSDNLIRHEPKQTLDPFKGLLDGRKILFPRLVVVERRERKLKISAAG